MASNSEARLKPFIFIFDGPVSCSKLFGKILSTHPQLQSTNGYPYVLAGSRGPEQIPAALSDATIQRLMAKWQNEVKEEDLKRWAQITFAKANSDVTDSIQSIQRQHPDKLAVVQEHAVLCMKPSISLPCLRQGFDSVDWRAETNPTRVDIELLRDCIAVILVRHPALLIPSHYRKQKKEEMLDIDDEAFNLWNSLSWIRIMYDFFNERSQQDGSFRAPIVVDAQDVVHDTANLLKKLGSAFGIDPSGFKETWSPTVDDPVPEGVVASFHERLRNSTGVERGGDMTLDYDISLEKKTKEWTEEFGSKIAQNLRSKVDLDMPAYLYLQSRKI